MCRLVAYAGGEISPATLVFGGTHSLYRQSRDARELQSGSLNAEGYGVVWYREERPVRVAEARPIWYDEELEGLLRATRSRCVVAAIRDATPGMGVDRRSVAPILVEGWAFALNGWVPDFHARHMRSLRQTLPDDLYAKLRGSSDTETLAMMAIAALHEGADPGAALARVARRVFAEVGERESPLTMVLSSAEGVAAVHTSNYDATNSLYVASTPELAPGGGVLASERLDEDPAWRAVPPHHAVEIAQDGAVMLRPVSEID